MIKQELHILLTAIMFYTRIKVPKNTAFSDEMLNAATRYFPFIGLIVGGTGALVFWILSMFLPLTLAIIFSMATTVLLTGAFHEDAFADFCDGFGGGYTSDRILEIMKDSHIGTYGAVGLIFILLSKFFCISSFSISEIPIMLFIAHTFSRFMSVCLIYTSEYVRKDALSKSKPIGHKGTLTTFLIAGIFGVAGLFFISWKESLVIFALTLPLFIYFRWYVTRKLGGYTGDVLGALQQLTEIAVYLGVIIAKQAISISSPL